MEDEIYVETLLFGKGSLFKLAAVIHEKVGSSNKFLGSPIFTGLFSSIHGFHLRNNVSPADLFKQRLLLEFTSP